MQYETPRLHSQKRPCVGKHNAGEEKFSVFNWVGAHNMSAILPKMELSILLLFDIFREEW